jgi:hypothetical protein
MILPRSSLCCAGLVTGSITEMAGGCHVEATMTGPAALDLNRSLLSALRQAERRSRLRAEWTAAVSPNASSATPRRASFPSSRPAHHDRPAPVTTRVTQIEMSHPRRQMCAFGPAAGVGYVRRRV